MRGIRRGLIALSIVALVVYLLPMPQAQAASYSRELTESLSLADSVVAHKYSPLESLSLADAIVANKFTPTDEGLPLTDSLLVDIYRFYTRDVSDNLSFSDLVEAIIYWFNTRDVSDSFSFSDLLNILIYRLYTRDALEGFSTSDALVINKFTPIEDALDFSDVVRSGVHRMGEGGAEGVPMQYLPLPALVTPEGVFTQTVVLKSLDNNLQVTVVQGTTATNKTTGAPLLILNVFERSLASMPDSASDPTFTALALGLEDIYVIGKLYELGPKGTVFDEPVFLTFTYDPAALPAGISERNLVIGYWDEEQGIWVLLDSIVDTIHHTVSAAVNHFTVFAVLGLVPTPAAFTIKDLTVLPHSVEIGEKVTVSLFISNTGGSEGTYPVTLLVNGVKEAEENVTIAGGGTAQVTFTLSKEEPGEYSVAVAGLVSSFIVAEEAAPAETPEKSVMVTESLPLKIEPVSPSPPAPPVPAPVPPSEHTPTSASNLWLILAIAAGAISAGLLTYFFIKRRA